MSRRPSEPHRLRRATQGIDAEWLDLNRGVDTEIIQQMVDLGRHFDLIVLGQFQYRKSS